MDELSDYELCEILVSTSISAYVLVVFSFISSSRKLLESSTCSDAIRNSLSKLRSSTGRTSRSFTFMAITCSDGGFSRIRVCGI